MGTQLVLTAAPDAAIAQKLTEHLVHQGLAACVKQMPPCRSTYRWQGAIEQTEEIPLFIITDSSCYEALERYLVTAHPYKVPEIVAIPIQQGLPEYLAWVTDTCQITP